MGTILGTDERLVSFSTLAEQLSEDLVKILAENYNAGTLSLCSNATNSLAHKEVFFNLTGNEFENETLQLVYRLTDTEAETETPFEIRLESIGLDNPTEFKIQVYSELLEKIPKKMLEELEKFIYEDLE